MGFQELTPEELKYWHEEVPGKIEKRTKNLKINGFFHCNIIL